jgi:hypothetical protein
MREDFESCGNVAGWGSPQSVLAFPPYSEGKQPATHKTAHGARACFGYFGWFKSKLEVS